MKHIIGRKLGMTSIFAENGEFVPVTVIAAGPCQVVERKTKDAHGYDAVVLGFEDAKLKGLTKSLRGRFEKLSVAPKTVLHEFRGDHADVKGGDLVTVSSFEAGDRVDVTGTSKGKGFAGIIKRWNGSGGGASHGSMIHRQPASNGDTNAAKTVKGSRRPGHLGVERVTTLNLEVISTDEERNLLMLRGTIPGGKRSIVFVRPAVRAKRKAQVS
ncbi:MAG: 50S ribosomal protein L3 [Candidatus Eremiobacteraeota bacterium]|nr:50S ribosomal protein L3 [Candidatus Eremiobacteraeota bacterium]